MALRHQAALPKDLYGGALAVLLVGPNLWPSLVLSVERVVVDHPLSRVSPTKICHNRYYLFVKGVNRSTGNKARHDKHKAASKQVASIIHPETHYINK